VILRRGNTVSDLIMSVIGAAAPVSTVRQRLVSFITTSAAMTVLVAVTAACEVVASRIAREAFHGHAL
jgi:hypothetical protein